MIKKLIFDDVITQIENGQSPTLTVSAGQQFRAAPAMAELVSSTSGGEKGGTTASSIHFHSFYPSAAGLLLWK